MPKQKQKSVIRRDRGKAVRERLINVTDEKFWGHETNYADVGSGFRELAPGCSRTKPAPTYG